MDEHTERKAVVACGAVGEDNCRHDWNKNHPDDPVTEEEQLAFEAAHETDVQTAYDNNPELQELLANAMNGPTVRRPRRKPVPIPADEQPQ